MNQSTAQRVRTSFQHVSPRLDAVVSGFYDRLFARAPLVRPLFPADMSKQKYHVAAAFALILRNIDCLGALEESLMGLGAQHVRFGAQPELYPVVRDSLVDSIAEHAGPSWNDQLHRDWTDAINAVSAIMLKGAARMATETASTMVNQRSK